MKMTEKEVEGFVSSLICRCNEKEKQQFEQVVTDVLVKGKKNYEAMGVDKRFMGWVHQYANEAYSHGQYQKARDAFSFLLLLDPDSFDYAFGVAASYHQMKDYANALNAYATCIGLDASNPLPHLHGAECLLALEEKILASMSLQGGIALAKDVPQYKEIKKQAEALVHAINGE